MLDFREFMECLVVEELHPELHQVISSTGSYASKQSLLAKKIKDLSKRGLSTGIEGNMPKGSARAYMKHDTPMKVHIDGKPQDLHTGTKVAITAALDKHHNHKDHDGMRLGALQNHAEAGDHWVNSSYRILRHEGQENGVHKFTSNKDRGIFPPLIDHDHVNNEWSHVGHVRDMQPGEFQKLTKTESHPKGLKHKDFVDALVREHHRNTGRRWNESEKREAELDHVTSHPLFEKFNDYHGNTGNSPSDYGQKKNLGVWQHPDGSHHIIARDHGYDSAVEHAYQQARSTANKKSRGW